MKVYDIKWDVTDGTNISTPEEIEEILAILPKEIELPEEFDKANYMEDGEFNECAWLDIYKKGDNGMKKIYDALDIIKEYIGAEVY